ncbi:hypothetical protein HSB1_26840 [Halogranum salarium B-1]|uniref:Uncharacterized protein n=1 Tax=Halogranum salarium B-1 TaxID=1210908 RepID=J3A1S0_9EURY|nr:hypothetical protein HSB1_26840 [Halogranum salarium B-1]
MCERITQHAEIPTGALTCEMFATETRSRRTLFVTMSGHGEREVEKSGEAS